jgi:hypothetical protein
MWHESILNKNNKAWANTKQEQQIKYSQRNVGRTLETSSLLGGIA